MVDDKKASDAAATQAAEDTAPRDAETAEAAAPDPEQLQRERDDYYERLLRKTAEFDNYRKRVERERREQADQALVGLLRELLPIVDDFDRARSAQEDQSVAAYRKGVELIHSKLYELLRKHGAQPIEALGADFNPRLHEAVLHEASPGHRDGEVIEELSRGYTMGQRLLRPAMVKVAKA